MNICMGNNQSYLANYCTAWLNLGPALTDAQQFTTEKI